MKGDLQEGTSKQTTVEPRLSALGLNAARIIISGQLRAYFLQKRKHFSVKTNLN